MSHGEGPQNESELGIRLSEELKDESKGSIEDQKKRNHHTVAKRFLAKNPQQGEENRALHEGFIELRGMARDGAASWKDHGPRNIRGPAEEFAVNEVADPSKAQADGRSDNDAVRYGPERHPLGPAEQPPCDGTAYETAVKGHAAMPDRNDFEWAAEEIPHVMILIEENVSQPCPCDETYEDVEEEGIHPGSFEADGPGALLSWDQEIRGEKSQHVHQAVPSHMERADGHQVGIDVRIRNHFQSPLIRCAAGFYPYALISIWGKLSTKALISSLTRR